jgi:hypothetical protein
LTCGASGLPHTGGAQRAEETAARDDDGDGDDDDDAQRCTATAAAHYTVDAMGGTYIIRSGAVSGGLCRAGAGFGLKEPLAEGQLVPLVRSARVRPCARDCR